MRMRMIVNRFERISSSIAVTGTLVVAFVATLALPGPLHAEVVEASEHAFTVKHVVERADTPRATWARLIEPADWWHPDHTWSGEAGNLSLEARAGGCFCETLDDGGSAEHLRVIHVAPDRLLRLDGRLGPLQSLAVTGVLTFELAAVETGTRITLTYTVSGAAGSGLGDWAAAVDGVLGVQLARLAAEGDAARKAD